MTRLNPEINQQRINVLRSFLAERKMSQQRLAHIIKMDVRQVNRWANNKADVPYWLLMLILGIKI